MPRNTTSEVVKEYRRREAEKKGRRSEAAKKAWEKRRATAQTANARTSTGQFLPDHQPRQVDHEYFENMIDPVPTMIKVEAVNHPAHYGGADDPYEAIKVIEAWGLGFNLGNAVKYICRAGKKSDLLEDLQKAAWYLNREIDNIEAHRGA